MRECLEERTLLAASWNSLAQNPQHTAISSVASQSLDSVRWQTPVDLNPQFSGNDLLIHYGSPLVTAANTVIVPVKTGASGGFEVQGHSGVDGTLKWTLSTDYILPAHDWVPSFEPVVTPSGRLYFAGAGGTLYFSNSPDANGATVNGQVAFYGIGNYSHAAFDSSVFIDTPITSDSAGDLFFGFTATASAPLGIKSGIARIAPDGTGSWISATAAAGDANINHVVMNNAPAVSNDGSTIYIAVSTGDFGSGYLLALDSTTLARKGEAHLIDPSTLQLAALPDDGSASPTVGPDGDVYFGVLENPFASNHDRGWLLHFSGDLTKSLVPGLFGWDDTPSIVPASMVPSYHGASSYLLMTKYNNYAGEGGDGVNKIAILDPHDSQTNPLNSVLVMKEILTIAGVTPDPEFDASKPSAVREWCINTAAVDPATDSILANSEDGKLYRWNLTTNTFTQEITLTPGVGEAYTPTVIGVDGTVYAINNATLFAVGAPLGHTVDDSQAGYSETGPGWTTWNSGFDGEQRYVAAGTGASTATWVMSGLASGTYTVQATWFANSDHATNAPYQFYDGSNLIQSTTVDQTQLPNGLSYGNQPFQTLATVTVTSGTLKVVLSNSANGYVLADAIRVAAAVPASPTTLPAILDDGANGFSQTGPGWLSYPDGYGGEIRYVAAGTGGSTAGWQVTGLATGDYAVQATWLAASNHATNAAYQIFDGANLVQTVVVNQTLAPTGPTFGNEPFQTLATVHITSGTLKVVLSNNANGYVLADAVRIASAPPPTSNLPLIVDDGTPSYAETGPGWTTWNSGYNNEQRYVAAGTGGSTASWVVTGLPSGTYTVQTTWFANSDHATNAPYQFFDGANLVQTVFVDQTQTPSGPVFGNQPFQTVATVTVTSGTLKVVLSNSANGYVMADAIRVDVAVTPPPITLPAILDDGATGYTQTGPGWTSYPDGYGGELRYVAAGTGGSSATWQVTGLATGDYTVQATWLPFSNHATNAPYLIYDGSTLVQTVLVNQQVSPTGPTFGNEPFQMLATVHITTGTLKVVLTNSANGYVLADAVRIAVAPPPTVSLPLIVDDSTGPYTETGPGWTTWNSGYNGEQRYVAAGTGGSTASWQVTGLATGDYTVQATWFAHSDHASNAPYQIFDGANLVQTVLVDQRQQPSGDVYGNEPFQILATVHITSGTLSVVLSNNANGYVLADAIRVAVPTPPAPPTLPSIIDDGTANYAQTGPNWQSWPDGYGGELRYAPPGAGESTASWQLSGLASGSYIVQATWLTASNHATNAPYLIYDGSTLLQTVLVNQQIAPSGPTFGNEPFQTLATVNVTSGTLTIVLTNSANGYVLADAIRVTTPAIGSVSSLSAGLSGAFGSKFSTADAIDNGDLVSLVPVLADSSTDPAHRRST